MPRSTKEQVDITALLQGILNGYPGNTAIFREYLQNSDDAKATKQIFILDERQHPSESLCDPSLRDSQGPAIVAFNDGVLTDSDWEALRKIHSSNKKMDETQTGKNGLGFRASYHLTENPHVLSGSTLMILDPHHRFDEHPGGLSIDIVAEGAAYPDQLKPFMEFMSDGFSPVSGTVFRLPLRTEMQAKKSKIKNTPTPVGQIRTLLEDFCKNELEQVILFLKHITSIEIRHIDPDGHSRIMGTVSIKDMFAVPLSQKEVKFREISLRREDGSITESRWCFRSVVIDKGDAAKVLSERLGYDVGDSFGGRQIIFICRTGYSSEWRSYHRMPLYPIAIADQNILPPTLKCCVCLDSRQAKSEEYGGSWHDTVARKVTRLVEWNKVIFEVWSPRAWADLLEELSASNALWSMWPPEETNGYWENLTVNLVKEVLDRKSSIFPIVCDEPTFLSLDSSVLISPPSFPLSLIRLLAKLGVKIVQPPAHIFAILASNNVLISAPILSPETLHNVLAAGYEHNQWRPYDPINIGEIIEYLVFSTSPPSLGNLIGLPWFLTAKGSPFAFQGVGVGQTCIIPSEEEEVHLFGPYLQMLALPCSSAKLLSALRVSGSGMILNIASLQPSHVMTILSSRFTLECEASSSDLLWVLAFWTWLEGWDIRRRTCVVKWERLSDLYLLPTTSHHLRRTSDKVVHFNAADTSAATAWEKLGVPLLHSDVCTRAMIMLSNEGFIQTPEKPGFVAFLLENSDILLQQNLSADDFEAIRQSLYSAAIRQRFPVLSSRQKKILEQLLIFSVRNPNGGQPTLKSISGTRLYVMVSDDFPLPFQNPLVTYVDIGDPTTKSLIEMLERIQLTDSLGLLCIAVDHWDLQPFDLQDRLINLILDNWRKLPERTRKKLVDLPFVTVNGTPSRAPPKNLIHPNALITPLFEDEIGRIPIGRFAAYPTVDIMCSLGFLPTSLDRTIIQERLQYLSRKSSHDQKLFDKASILVRLIDQHWDGSFDQPIRSHRDLPWMPQEAPSTLCSPNQSRDHYRGSTHSDPNFYDFVLTILSQNVSNANFRSALGWSDRVPTDILVCQLSKTIALSQSEVRYQRLNKIIKYMSRLHEDGSLSSEDMSSIRSKLTSCSWIPISASMVETVKTEYALLSGEDLKPPFRQIGLVGCRRFLMNMGCTNRPKLEVLIIELQKYGSNIVPHSDIPTVIALLQEIACCHQGFESASISVLDQSRRSRPISDVYYPDTDYLLPMALEDKYRVHNSISRTLSDQLGIRTLSSLLLDLGEDVLDEDEQMAEDLIDRIRGFLQEYDITYALNEFLANADDAHAREFSILLDHRRPPKVANGLISPAFYDLQNHDTVVLFNDSILSNEDFKGLRRVGRGGKTGQVDTHGRHGLGALSFYYFTDVVTVISGEYVMILDPSGRYLPSSPGQKRTSLVRKLSSLIGQYPNQLKQYESLFGFSKGATYYHGALFCLPLTTSISAKPCSAGTASTLLQTSYRDLALNAFFFTKLEKITSKIRDGHNEERVLWSFVGRREGSRLLQAGLSYHLLDVDSDTWMISTSQSIPIPDRHKPTAMGLKLLGNTVRVQLAIKLKRDLHQPTKSRSWLFSTLRLPRTTSLPFHLNARFAISSNRQSIVFDSPDSRKDRDPKSEFNAWILAEVVPPLYIASLTHIINYKAAQNLLPHKRWWLLEPADDISDHVSQEFVTLLTKSDNKLFKTISGSMVSFSSSIFAKYSERVDPIVRSLIALEAPQLVTEYVSSVATLKSATTINEEYVRSVLDKTSLETIKFLFAAGAIKLQELLELLHYIRNTPRLAGLPLLVLSTDIPVPIPDTSSSRIYFSDHAEHADLFESARFLHQEYYLQLIPLSLDKIWDSSSVNIVRLDENEAGILIRKELDNLSGPAKANWLEKFWRLYDTLPGPPSPDSLVDVPCIQIQGSLCYYSPRQCQPDRVILVQTSITDLLHPLQHLGIDVVNPENEVIKAYLRRRFPEPIVNILKCLAAKNITHFRTLSQAEAKRLRHWLTACIELNIFRWRQNDAGIDRAYLSRMEIWAAHSGRGEVLRSASTLSMLPSHFPIEVLIRYIRPGCAVASNSDGLSSVLRFCKYLEASSVVTMTPGEILNSVDIPSLITNDERMRTFAVFLHNLFSFNTYVSIAGVLRIFDVNGRAQHVHTLYDHTIPLFSVSLKHSSPFVHPLLRNVDLQVLHALGLQNEISVPTFRTCVMEVQAANRRHLRDDTPVATRSELFEMAHVAFECYMNILPRKIMRDSFQWASLDRIEFVRPKEVRRQGASYPAEQYCQGRLRVLLPPSHFVLAALEPIAWTQRFLFFDEPTEDVILLNNKLGIPEMDEVVAHLKILTTKIAVRHPGDPTLLSDIKATYKWLNDHAEDAREHMILLGREKIFLNVDDPREDSWIGQWTTADELVLNVSYDYGDVKRVKTFLQDYANLLRVAGCSMMTFWEPRTATTEAPHLTKSGLMEIFNEMRKRGKTTDMVLVPTTADPDEVLESEVGKEIGPQTAAVLNSSNPAPLESNEDTDQDNMPVDIQDDVFADLLKFRAHQVVLAASSSYVRTWAEEWSHHTSHGIDLLIFDGTDFCAKAVLDFIYTGAFDFSIPQSEDGFRTLLYEFLALLRIAETWDMPDLKEKVENEIHKHDLVQRFLPLYPTMLRAAERYRANRFRDSLNQMARENSKLLQRFSLA